MSVGDHLAQVFKAQKSFCMITEKNCEILPLNIIYVGLSSVFFVFLLVLMLAILLSWNALNFIYAWSIALLDDKFWCYVGNHSNSWRIAYALLQHCGEAGHHW